MDKQRNFYSENWQSQLTAEEKLYTRLLWAYLHYNSGDGEGAKALEKSSELLKEVRASNLADDFKKYFENLFKDQASKLYETHQNWAKGLKARFDSLFEKQEA